mmetsp:Transcript_9821/g.24487  ORF Transcript_9821/g.24487 Transcript_9821/m.24487 type:complete len:157 (-) Transcript_9821:265-735(-)
MDPEAGTTEPLLAQQPAVGTSTGPNPVVVVSEAPPQEPSWLRLLRKAHSQISNVGTSMLLGLGTAFALKTIGQSVAIALVLLFIGLQVLAYYGFVNFNWRSVGGAVVRQLDLNADGRVDIHDCSIVCKRVVTWSLAWGIPAVLGFMLGFWLGWRFL